jgi:hypothetical protein
VKQSYNRTEPSQEETKRYGVELGQKRTAEILKECKFEKQFYTYCESMVACFVSKTDYEISCSSYPSPGVDLSLISEESAIINFSSKTSVSFFLLIL